MLEGLNICYLNGLIYFFIILSRQKLFDLIYFPNYRGCNIEAKIN